MLTLHPPPSPASAIRGLRKSSSLICTTMLNLYVNSLFFPQIILRMSSVKCSCSSLSVHTCLKHARCLRKHPHKKSRLWNPTGCRDCIYLVAEGLDAESQVSNTLNKFLRVVSNWAHRVSFMMCLQCEIKLILACRVVFS